MVRLGPCPPGQKPAERNFSQVLEFKGVLELSVGWPKSTVFGQSGLATFCVHLLREGQDGVTATGDDLGGDLLLTPHRVDHHQGAGADVVGTGPGTDQVQRHPARSVRSGAPSCRRWGWCAGIPRPTRPPPRSHRRSGAGTPGDPTGRRSCGRCHAKGWRWASGRTGPASPAWPGHAWPGHTPPLPSRTRRPR
jgi:hypothetical protein